MVGRTLSRPTSHGIQTWTQLRSNFAWFDSYRSRPCGPPSISVCNPSLTLLLSVTLTLLTSQKNGLITVYDVGRGSDALLHSYTTPYALTAPLGSAATHNGCHYVSLTEGTASGVDLHMFQLSSRGGLHQLDCTLAPPQEDTASEPADYSLDVQWSSEVKRLNRVADRMRPEDGPLGRRNGLDVDFSELYQSTYIEPYRSPGHLTFYFQQSSRSTAQSILC